jgi:flagellar secretion chaperone FliS
MSNYGANQYKQMAVKTANRGQILIMLYEAAVQNVKKATAAIDAKDIAGKGVAIGKVHDIINELLNTLDFEVGGQIAIDLERLYNFMTEQLIQANMDGSKEKLGSVQKLLETLLDGWRAAVIEANKGSAK